MAKVQFGGADIAATSILDISVSTQAMPFHPSLSMTTKGSPSTKDRDDKMAWKNYILMRENGAVASTATSVATILGVVLALVL